MPYQVICDSQIQVVPNGGGPGAATYVIDGVATSIPMPYCSSGWQIIDYIEPSDSTAVYAQLVALNEFNPIRIAAIVTGCLVLFMLGFGAGMVVKYLRRL